MPFWIKGIICSTRRATCFVLCCHRIVMFPFPKVLHGFICVFSDPSTHRIILSLSLTHTQTHTQTQTHNSHYAYTHTSHNPLTHTQTHTHTHTRSAEHTSELQSHLNRV